MPVNEIIDNRYRLGESATPFLYENRSVFKKYIKSTDTIENYFKDPHINYEKWYKRVNKNVNTLRKMEFTLVSNRKIIFYCQASGDESCERRFDDFCDSIIISKHGVTKKYSSSFLDSILNNSDEMVVDEFNIKIN